MTDRYYHPKTTAFIRDRSRAFQRAVDRELVGSLGYTVDSDVFEPNADIFYAEGSVSVGVYVGRQAPPDVLKAAERLAKQFCIRFVGFNPGNELWGTLRFEIAPVLYAICVNGKVVEAVDSLGYGKGRARRHQRHNPGARVRLSRVCEPERIAKVQQLLASA